MHGDAPTLGLNDGDSCARHPIAAARRRSGKPIDTMTKLTSPSLTMLDKYFGAEFEGLYTASVRATGGKADHGRASGTVRSDDGHLELDLRLPEALGGPGGGTNPEQLFAASYAACFHGALALIAAKNDIALSGTAVDVSVTFGRDPVDGMYTLSADIKIHLPGVDRETAEQLVRATERICPYAKMARQGIVNVVALQV
jgi:lipoyl-dependent peroxiredoxin